MRALITNKLYLSALGVVLVFLAALAYLFAAVLDTPLTSRPDKVTVELTSTGGLFEGSAVTYRGVKVGKISDIRLGDKGVEATAVLTSSERIPRDTAAKVRSLSPVGEQYLDFQPRSKGGPFLTDGSVIPATATELPKTLASTVISINKILGQVDEEQLHSVLTELSTGLSGTGDELGRLVDQGDLLLADLERIWPETERLLTNGGKVLDIGTDTAGDIEQLATSSKQFAAFLKSYDPELRQTLKAAPAQIKQLRALVGDMATSLPGFLSEGVSFTDLTRAHDPHLRTLLATYADGLGALGSTFSQGALQVQILPQVTKICSYGTPRRDPKNPDRQALKTDGRCAASFSGLQRGAAHAPGPVT